MTIATTRADLRAALGLVVSASATKSSIEILDGALFAPAGDAGLVLSCTSLTIAAAAPLACKHAGESFVVTAETFRRVVDSMPEGPIEISEKDGRITVVGGTSKVKLPVRDARDFPKIPSAPAATVKVRADALARLFMATRHAVHTDTPTKDGTHLRVTGTKIEATVCGGHSLGRAWGECEALAPLEAFIPSLGVNAILKALSSAEDDEIVSIAVTDSRVFVAHVSAQLYSESPMPADKLLAGLKNSGEICVAREALIAAVKRASLTADEAQVTLTCCQGTSLVVASESATGESVTTLPASVPAADPIIIAAHYLLSQLEQLPDDEARIRLSGLDVRSPPVFGSSNYTGVVMPILPKALR